MTEYVLYILTAFALVFVIEGLLYALFPEKIRELMALAITLPERQFRAVGFSMAVLGFVLVWIIGLMAGT